MEFFTVSITKSAQKRVVDVLKSGFISEGKVVKAFELALSDRLGVKNPVAVNSGTAALHLGLVAGGIQPGDEVIIPAQTFVATGLAVLMQGAVPVFADIQYETGNIDPVSIQEKITSQTRAIIPVHWGGYPCDMAEINTIAKKNDLVIIEDAAHACGATYKGMPVGAISQFTAFSFQAIKSLTTGDGGGLCCLNKPDYEIARKSRWFGIDRDSSKPSDLGERIFDIDAVGYKYHMNDIAAAIGLGNMESFSDHLKRRCDIAAFYRQELRDVPGLQLLRSDTDRESAHWLFTMLANHRLSFIETLKKCGIPASVVHQGIDRFSVFKEYTSNLPNQRRFDQNQVAIPIHADLTDDETVRIVSTIKKGWP